MNFRNPYINQVFSIIKKLIVLLVLYTFSRLLFYVFNAPYFHESSIYQLFKVFFFGIRFDFSAIIQFNLILIFFYALPFPFANNSTYKNALFTIFWIVNSLLLLFNFGDIEYFKYTSKRTTADIFKYATTGDDAISLIPQFLKDFWYIPLLWILTVAAGIWLTREKNRITQKLKFKPLNLIGMLILLTALFAGARGIGIKPLRIISAARYASSQEIPLLINTPFTILHTLQEKNNFSRVYFSENGYQHIYSPLHQYKAVRERNDNVIVLILESFSHEFIGTLSRKKSYTPFLDSLLNESLTFENGFANCRKSIEGIPAILAGLPSLTNNSYISSQYAGNRLKALPYILRKHGYKTSFFHGGKNGTMSFDEFSKVAGIDHYFGMNEYKGPDAFDSKWGIYDDEFLQYSITELNKNHTPFFAAIYTLSSHHPYNVPKKYNSEIPKNELPQLRAIRYSDIALRNFFKTAQYQPWFRNTLFVIVADHTAKVIDREYNNPVGMFRIPIAFYHPSNDTLKGRRTDIAQQTDIMPSIIHYLGIEDKFLAYGNSVFFDKRKPFAINYIGNLYYYFSGDFLLTFDGEVSQKLTRFHKNKLVKSEHKDSLEILELNLKATIQDYQFRLKSNNLTYN